MEHQFTQEELAFLKSLLLDAQFAAEKVPPGPWKGAIRNNERKISGVWSKVNALQPAPAAAPVEDTPDLWVSIQHGQVVAIPGHDTPDTSVYKDWRKANYA